MIGGEEREVGGAADKRGELGEDEMGIGVGGVAGLDGLEVEEGAAPVAGEERGGGEAGGD